jgi:hypothetical protein
MTPLVTMRVLHRPPATVDLRILRAKINCTVSGRPKSMFCVHSFKRCRCIDPASGYYRVAEARTIIHYYCTLSLPLINPPTMCRKATFTLFQGSLQDENGDCCRGSRKRRGAQP